MLREVVIKDLALILGRQRSEALRVALVERMAQGLCEREDYWARRYLDAIDATIENFRRLEEIESGKRLSF